jgi:hypothetical protein
LAIKIITGINKTQNNLENVRSKDCGETRGCYGGGLFKK